MILQGALAFFGDGDPQEIGRSLALAKIENEHAAIIATYSCHMEDCFRLTNNILQPPWIARL